MYDLSSKFNTFYSSNVVLSQAVQAELYDKKDLNIQRLKDGLKEYNEENGTSYSVVETCVQGSVAMSTVVQNEDSDYDIDVAVVFNKAALGNKGAQATRNMVANEKIELKNRFLVKDDNKVSIDESSRDDYRLRMENQYLRNFVKRFNKKAERERVDDLSQHTIIQYTIIYNCKQTSNSTTKICFNILNYQSCH